MHIISLWCTHEGTTYNLITNGDPTDIAMNFTRPAADVEFCGFVEGNIPEHDLVLEYTVGSHTFWLANPVVRGEGLVQHLSVDDIFIRVDSALYHAETLELLSKNAKNTMRNINAKATRVMNSVSKSIAKTFTNG